MLPCYMCSYGIIPRLFPIEELSVGHISVLRKLSLVKLTAQLELYSYKSRTSM